MKNNGQINTKKIEGILKDKVIYKNGELLSVVNSALKDKNKIISLVAKHQTPFYLYNQQNLDNSIKKFTEAFQREIPSFKAYYAIKINHYFPIVERVVKKGMGLDVGSTREIDIAIQAGSKEINQNQARVLLRHITSNTCSPKASKS